MQTHGFYFYQEREAIKVLDRDEDLLLRQVYSGQKGYLKREDATPFKTFRIGRFGYYFDPWRVCFWKHDLTN